MSENHKKVPGYFGVGKRLLSVKEAAEYLGLKVQTMYNWRHNRKGPDYVMIGGAPKYEMEALELFISNNRVVLN